MARVGTVAAAVVSAIALMATAAGQDAPAGATPTAAPAEAPAEGPAEPAAEAPSAAASAAPITAPARVWIEDTPNDDGKKLTVRWEGGDGADAADVEIHVEVATSTDGPWLPIAGPLPARGAWFKDLESDYGPFAMGGEGAGHAAVISPLSLAMVKPGKLVDLAMAADDDAKAMVDRKQVEAILGAGLFTKVKEIIAGEGVQDKSGLGGHTEEAIMTQVSYLVLERPWYARLQLRREGAETVTALAPEPTEPGQDLFDLRKLNNFVFMVLLSAVVLILIQRARKNPDLYLRRIPGLDAVEEALGRATEMGKPVLFVHGLNPMDTVSTIAAVNILGEVSKKVARYDSRLMVTNYDPIVLAVSQETVKEGYTHAGRPDAYSSDDVFLAASEQFAYVAAVDGIMLRQKPAANFYVGYFYAESLLLAETGAASGAIQIAATDSFTQLPFFVTTCDYTLMGEELYAASAYLSRDPLLLGSLKGQDWGKAIIIVVLLIGTVFASLDITWFEQLIKPY
jgi:hypothetical protein